MLDEEKEALLGCLAEQKFEAVAYTALSQPGPLRVLSEVTSQSLESAQSTTAFPGCCYE